MNRSLIAFATLAVLAITACQSSSDDARASGEKAIHDLVAQWNQDFATHDPDKISSHYADDAVLMVPGMAAINGKTAIHDAIKQMETDPAMLIVLQPSKVEVANSGDLAFSQGTYTLTETDPATKQIIKDHGSYLTTYRKGADGTWKAVRDMTTSEPPADVPATVQAH
jgi:uncharacterized protein (TIGR02246 family)